MKPKILIVEDEPTDATNFDRTLKSLGYDVVGIASTGEEAIVKSAELRPDLILLSLVIKGSPDGFETASILKNDMEVPVVYLTTQTDMIMENRATLTYPYFYMIKPVSRTDLKKMVELAFEKHEIESNLKRNDERLIIEKELAFKLSGLSQLDEILNTCLDAVITVSGMDCGGIYLVDEISGNLKLKAHTGLSDDFVASATSYHADSNNTRIVMEGEPIFTNYQEIKTYLTEAQQKENLKAFISTPIKYQGKVIANLNLASHTIYKITEANNKL